MSRLANSAYGRGCQRPGAGPTRSGEINGSEQWLAGPDEPRARRGGIGPRRSGLRGSNLPAIGSASAAVSGPAVARPPVVRLTAKSTGALQAVSRLPSRWCMAVGSSANNKSVAWVWEHGAWHQLNDPPGDGLVNVSCPTRTFCLAFGAAGLFGAVVWNGTTWRFMTPGPNNPKLDVSCPSSRFCAVINGVGRHKSGPIAETLERPGLEVLDEHRRKRGRLPCQRHGLRDGRRGAQRCHLERQRLAHQRSPGDKLGDDPDRGLVHRRVLPDHW